MKKWTAFLMAAVLCLSVIHLGHATCANHSYVAQRTGNQRYMPVEDNAHQLMDEFIYVCKLCGATAGPTYAPALNAQKKAHVNGQWNDYHAAGTTVHTFYRNCMVCGTRLETVQLSCPGGLGHVTYP